MASQGHKQKLTPMMQQYMGAKSQYPDAVVFFRMGDFFEMFFDDARLASEVLGIALTHRNKMDDEPIPMAGIPHHSYRNYVNKMVEAGYTVVICDQVEDAKLAKGLVRRDVTRIVTPGMVLDPDDLDAHSNHFLAAAFFAKKDCGVAHIDLTTGVFRVTELPPEEAISEILRIGPREVLVSTDQLNTPRLDELQTACEDVSVKAIEGNRFALQDAFSLLCEHFDMHSLDGFGLGTHKAGIRAAGAIISYVRETQKTRDIPHISRLVPYTLTSYMIVDEVTRSNLELVENMRDRTRKGSLVGLIDRTVTPMGGRKLRQWLLYPLLDAARIARRHDAVELFTQHSFARESLRKGLKAIHDLERLNGKIASQIATPRDLGLLRQSLEAIPSLLATLDELGPALTPFRSLYDQLTPLPDVSDDIAAVLVDAPPAQTKDGGIIRDGYMPELDEYRDIAAHGKDRILEMEAREREITRIQSLKIKYNRVFGYYIEVTRPNLHLIPEDRYIRKQTMVNHERFITEDLKEFEEKVLNAEERSLTLEIELFEQLRARLSAFCPQLAALADAIAKLDVLATFAELATLHDFCRPTMTATPDLHIEAGRHPVVEQMMRAGEFVPNDIHMPHEQTRFILLTGPNMAGKSTNLRQVALIAILAQIGCFVPAHSATIGICDRVFTRVGASDNLSQGQSTFMVEMTETANILHHATENSLVILDEIGRGTSTFDGLSIAWAVAEHLHTQIGCRTLFATHYHELTELDRSLSGFHNMSVSISEMNGELHFLHRLVDGGSNRSYGIQVGKLAGLPKVVVRRAQRILQELEHGKLPNAGDMGGFRNERQLSLFVPVGATQAIEASPIEEEIRSLNLDAIAPLEALKLLHEWQAELAADATDATQALESKDDLTDSSDSSDDANAPSQETSSGLQEDRDHRF